MGRAAFEFWSVYDVLLANLKHSTKLFMDETTAPVLERKAEDQNGKLLGTYP